MELIKGIKALGNSLIIKNTLIIGDVHIGYEEALNKQGILVPRLQFKAIIEELDTILAKKKFETIVINGDIKHEFGRISEQEWRYTLMLLDRCLRNADEVVLIKGNHDTVIGPIAEKRNVTVAAHHVIDDILIMHGHTLPTKQMIEGINTIIIGHEHPAISITDGLRTESVKCFLVGRYKAKNLIVMPSFTTVTIGTDVKREKLLSPFLKEGVTEFKVYAVLDTILDFGHVKDIR